MPLTVLLVEDERDIADLVRYHVEQAGMRFLHAADGGTALRLALPPRDVDEARALVRRTVVGGALLAVAVAGVIGLFVSRRVTRPLRGMEAAARRMAEGDLRQAVPVAGSDEIAALGVALNRTAVALREKIGRLGDEQAKVRTILDGMTEEVMALDGRGRLLLLNPAARMMFGVENGLPGVARSSRSSDGRDSSIRWRRSGPRVRRCGTSSSWASP